MRSPSTALAALAALIPGLACSPSGEAAAADAAKTKKQGPRPAQVVVREARSGTVEDVWTFPAEVRALARASLAAGAGGEVVRLSARVGDRVERGQLLVEVDAQLAGARLAVAAARVRDAEESLAQAEREASRLSGLDDGVVPELEREQARSRRSRAEAELGARRAEAREARAQLALHRVLAPFDGVIAERSIDRGDWVKVGDPVMELVSDGRVEVLVDAGSALLGKVATGDVARLVGSAAELRVVGVVNALDPSTRTLRVRLEPSETPVPALVPGAAVEVGFSVRLGDGRGVVVPRDAVLFDGTRSRVVVRRDGQADVLEVEMIARTREEALVAAEGLAAGDEVVIRGNERVRPGQPLELEDR